jgi:hypothetical protein
VSEGCHWKRSQALLRIQKAREALDAEGICVPRGEQFGNWTSRVDALIAEYAAASAALASLSDCSE